MGNRWFGRSGLVALSAVLLTVGLQTGCGKPYGEEDFGPDSSTEITEIPHAIGTVENGEPEGGSEPGYEEWFRGRDVRDLLEGEWSEPGEVSNPSQFFRVTEYIENISEIPGYLNYCAVDGTKFYALGVSGTSLSGDSASMENVTWTLSCMDVETMDISRTELPKYEGKGRRIYLAGMDAANGKPVLFVQAFDEESGKTCGYYAVTYDPQRGIYEKEVDLLPALKDFLIPEHSMFLMSGGKCDSRGYYYFINEEQTRVAVLSAEGELLAGMEGFGRGQLLDSKCKTPEGICIWEAEDLAGDSLTYFYYTDSGVKTLARTEYGLAQLRYVNTHGDILYPRQGALVSWDTSTGEQERLLIGVEEAYSRCVGLMQNSKGKIFIFREATGGILVNTYTTAGPAEKVEITLRAAGIVDYYLRTAIEDFSRKHPGVEFKLLEENTVDADTGWNRLLAGLTYGGSDLFLVNRRQMEILQEKGALADLSDVLGEAVKEQILPAVLENGMVDGRLYGCTYYACVETLITPGSVWSGDTWTIGEALEKMEKSLESGSPLVCLHNNNFSKTAGQTAMGMFCSLLADLEHSPFMDLENNRADFENDLFYRVLEICKRLENPSLTSVSYQDDQFVQGQLEMVKDGECLSYCSMECTLEDFSRIMAAFDGEAVWNGFPTDGESGSFLRCYDMLVVNSSAKNREIIDEFIRYLYSKGYLSENDLPGRGKMIRRDLLKESVYEKVDWSSTPLQRVSANSWISLIPKPEGGSYLPEYLELLDSCRIKSGVIEQIEQIVFEEAEAYFAGDKSAQQVAGIIQRRVQLFLNERE